VRTTTGPERTTVSGATLDTYTRLEITGPDGTWKDVSTGLNGVDWLNSVTLTEQLDSNTTEFSASLMREASSTLSLAPLREDSLVNRNAAAAYAPMLELARKWRASVAVVGDGVTPVAGDYKQIGSGYIDRISVSDPTASIEISGRGEEAKLLDTFISVERIYGSVFPPGTPMETVIQSILNDNGLSAVTLYTPVSPSFGMVERTQTYMSVMEAITTIAETAGFVVRYRYDSANLNRLTLYKPKRTPDSSVTDGMEYANIAAVDAVMPEGGVITAGTAAWSLDTTTFDTGTKSIKLLLTGMVGDRYRTKTITGLLASTSYKITMRVRVFSDELGEALWGIRSGALSHYYETVVGATPAPPYQAYSQWVTLSLTVTSSAAGEIPLQFGVWNGTTTTTGAWYDTLTVAPTAGAVNWTIGPTEYLAMPVNTLDLSGVRNYIGLTYVDSELGTRTIYSPESNTSESISRFGKRYMGIDLPKDSQVNTQSRAQNFVDAVRIDLEFPLLDQQFETYGFWFVQLGDYGTLQANGVHYNVDQLGAVTGYTHNMANGVLRSVVATRGVPAGRYSTWLEMSYTAFAVGLQDGDAALCVIHLDGLGNPLTTGVKLDVAFPEFDCWIKGWDLLADQSGSIVIDLWRDSYANYPPTVADTITASAKPTLATAIKNQSAEVATWKRTINKGDTLRINVDSVTTITRATLALSLVKL